MIALTTLLAVVGLVASGDSYNKLLNFPSASTANYIRFEPGFPVLTGLTVCAWRLDNFSSNLDRYWFSYAVGGGTDANEIILGCSKRGRYSLHIRGFIVEAEEVPIENNQWVHVCSTWDSKSGVAVISVNGEAAVTKADFMKGLSLRAGGTLVIGQEQDTLGGGFDAQQAYVGNLYNINMWDYAFTHTEVASNYNAGICGSSEGSGPIVSYADILAEEMRGDVSVIDGECPAINACPVVDCPVVKCPVKQCPALFCPTVECPVKECPVKKCPEKECPAVVCPAVDCPDKECPPRDCPGIDAHQPDCWKAKEGVRFKDDVKMGRIEGDINAVKAACYASGTCLALTCTERKGVVSCDMLTSFGKEKTGKKMKSYVYTC